MIRAAQEPSTRLSAKLASTGLYVLAATMDLGAHLALARPIYALTDRLGAWVLFLVLLATIRNFLRDATRSVPIPPMIAAQVYVFYGLSQFSQERLVLLAGVYNPSAEAVSIAVWLAVIGELVCLLAYWVTSRLLGARTLVDRLFPQPSGEWKAATIIYSVPALGVYTISAFRPDYLPVAVRMVILQSFNAYLALGLLLYQGYRLGDRASLQLGWLMIFVMALVAFVQGFMGTVAFPLIIGFISAWLWGGTIRMRWVVLAIVGVIVINPAKDRYRLMAWQDKDVSSFSKITERLQTWVIAFEQAWGSRDEDSVKGNLMETADRSSDFLSFAQTIDFVPNQVPLNLGRGLETSLFYWIPRLVWPDKPNTSDLINNRYAIDFGYITTEGTKTATIGASLFTEGYWNFGWWGVLAFLSAAGVMLGLILGHSGRRSDVSTIVSLAYMGAAILLLQPLSMALPAAITFMVGIWIAFALVRGMAHILRGPIRRRTRTKGPAEAL